MFATTLANSPIAIDPEKAITHLREILWMHRFQVITWMLFNGAELPQELVADQSHPPVGQQKPDQPVPPK